MGFSSLVVLADEVLSSLSSLVVLADEVLSSLRVSSS